MPQVSSPSGLAGFNFEDISQQAQQKLTDCREEVARLLKQAQTDAERIRNAAKQQGLTEGREQAKREADQVLQQALQQRMGQHATAVKATIQQLAEMHQQWMQQYADSLVKLVLEISERVIRNRLEQEPKILVRWASDALQSARSATRISVAVHPETLAELGQDLEELLNTPGLPEDSVLVPDESVSREGVVVRQLGGEVDGSLQIQLEKLQLLLQEAT